MTNPITDYLTRIRNANMARHDSIGIPAFTIKKSLSGILKQEGFIHNYEVTDDNKRGMIKIFLKYGPNGKRVVSSLRRIFRSGLRNYIDAKNLPRVLNGFDITIISTSAGVITDKEARKKNVGDEVLAYAW